MLRLPDKWIWDSWIADDGELYHLFFLTAPRTLTPAQRHTSAIIERATSKDLIDWTYEGPALLPQPGSWDDLALWTGSVVRGDDGLWRMWYTAISTAGRGVFDQRLGLAESDDLATWRRVGDQPVINVDSRWYKTLDEDDTASETWRDPYVFRDPDGDGWHMFIAARRAGAPRFDDGVVAHARSADLRTWELGPPITGDSHGFGQLEVAQVKVVDGQPIMVFTCHPQEQTDARKNDVGHYSTYYVPGDSLLGPWDICRARPFEPEPYLFAAPLVQERDGGWAFVGFRNQEPEGIFSFDIIDPVRVQWKDGELRLR